MIPLAYFDHKRLLNYSSFCTEQIMFRPTSQKATFYTYDDSGEGSTIYLSISYLCR